MSRILYGTLARREYLPLLPIASLTSQARAEERQRRFYLAICAEFIGTYLFLLPIYGVLAHAKIDHWSSNETTLASAITTACSAASMICCFFAISGAQFNPAIAFALLLRGKQTITQTVVFSAVQYLSAFLSLLTVWAIMPRVDEAAWKAIALSPTEGAARKYIFWAEVVLTFMMTFVALSTSPTHHRDREDDPFERSSSRFNYNNHDARLSLGLLPMAMCSYLITAVLCGAGSGVGMNPARYVAPAVIAADTLFWKEYILGEYVGAALAAWVSSAFAHDRD